MLLAQPPQGLRCGQLAWPDAEGLVLDAARDEDDRHRGAHRACDVVVHRVSHVRHAVPGQSKAGHASLEVLRVRLAVVYHSAAQPLVVRGEVAGLVGRGLARLGRGDEVGVSAEHRKASLEGAREESGVWRHVSRGLAVDAHHALAVTDNVGAAA
eukprot:scaffold77621_cov65-Phaeocystis_antarctica.AAC.4